MNDSNIGYAVVNDYMYMYWVNEVLVELYQLAMNSYNVLLPPPRHTFGAGWR